ncbi:pitrilysin family protein [Hyphococcus flavus]|uniref:Pitrilysin family protein n=1 Tax=Hyphococcus flavus TaxID=1866326 RepID=A0AAE9ZE81_9PROT|nr:pitrilysin family protein [Hyphococcus flavus]WDI31417.1 pitrilysin family protein [Hyphococcus flavus]
MTTIHTLSNGVRVIADPMPGLQTAAFGVWVKAGSMDERAGEHGVAHLLEHMAFKGTKKRTARSLAEEIESVGGYLNAATSHQRTGYYARLLKDDLATGADIVADILQNPVFSEGELEKEREVVIQEIGEVADTPDDVVFELLTEVTWKDHPLGRTILGTPETVRAQTPDSLRKFMDRWYRPQEMIIAASGAVDEASLLMLTEEYFSAMPDKGEPLTRTQPKFHGGVRHADRDIEQTHLALAFPGVASAHDDFFATRLLADILGGGMSSRLFQKIREERGLAYSVYAFADGFEQSGLFGAYVNAEAEHITESAEIIRHEMEDATRALDDQEIARAKALLRSSLMLGLESPASRIEAAAGQLFVYGALMTPEEILQRIDDISANDLKRCALRAFDGPCAVSIVGPGNLHSVSNLFADN